MSEAKGRYDELFAWYKPEENPDAPNWMKVVYNRICEVEQQNKELRESLKQCMTWLQKESKSMPNYDITQSVLWQNFEEILKQEERDD